MISYDFCEIGGTIKIVIGIILLASLSLTGSGNALSMSYSGDTINGSVAYGPEMWNRTNFPALVVEETLNVLDISDRTIAQDNLVYTTYGSQKMLNVVGEKYNDNGAAAAAAGLEEFGDGDMGINAGNYTITGWMAEKYVAIKAKSYKLSKLIIDQEPNDTKNLAVGEIWDMGEGWELTLNSTDMNALPFQAKLILSKDGIKKDDEVISSGTSYANPIYTFVEASLAGETNVPVLVTYADNITSDAVQLKYTWLISSNVTQLMSSDVFGSMKVTSTDPLTLKNTDTTILLARGSTINLMDNLYFRVNGSDILEYYPTKTFTLPPQPPNITSFAPSSPVNDIEGAARTFNITIDQTVNVTWSIDGTFVQANVSVIESNYTKTSALLGNWNVIGVATNANGTAIKTWVWIVTPFPTTGSISGFKINDINGNGKQDAGETGLANWEIKLTDSQGKTITNTTDSNGNYFFGGLAAGTYTIAEIPEGRWTQTFPAGTHTVVLTGEEHVIGNNFLNQRTEVSIPEFPGIGLIIPFAGLFSFAFVLLIRRDK